MVGKANLSVGLLRPVACLADKDSNLGTGSEEGSEGAVPLLTHIELRPCLVDGPLEAVRPNQPTFVAEWWTTAYMVIRLVYTVHSEGSHLLLYRIPLDLPLARPWA